MKLKRAILSPRTIEIIAEACRDGLSGKMKPEASLLAINTLIRIQPKPTPKVIEKAREIARLLGR